MIKAMRTAASWENRSRKASKDSAGAMPSILANWGKLSRVAR